MKKIFYLLVAGSFLVSCSTKNNRTEIQDLDLDTEGIEISREAISDIIENISSPIEMAAIIKEMGVPFNEDYLVDMKYLEKEQDNFKRAYMLGMLGADLGYLNVYHHTGSSLDYLTAINQLADELEVSQFFDFKTMTRMAKGRSDLDSLIFLSVLSFNNIDEYLRETKRSSLSALMITGVWLEGMFQVTRVVDEKYSSDLSEYIGEQKMVLNNLLLILSNFGDKLQFEELIEDYMRLKKVFDRVDISYEVGEPETLEQDGMLIIVQQERSQVYIDPATLEDIIETVNLIRNKHLLL